MAEQVSDCSLRWPFKANGTGTDAKITQTQSPMVCPSEPGVGAADDEVQLLTRHWWEISDTKK